MPNSPKAPDEPPDEPVNDTGLDRRTRICIWIILIGLANFVVYIILYACIWGEAVHGEVRVIEGQRQYVLHSGEPVSQWKFIYSGVHSISIWPTVGAIMLSMLTLAKDRIIMSAYSTARRGRAMITLLAVVIAIIVGILTFLFARDFVHRMHHPVKVSRSSHHRRLACAWRRGPMVCVPRGLGAAPTPRASDTGPPARAKNTAETAVAPTR